MVLAHNIDNGGRTRDIEITQDVTFDSMLLSTSTLLGLKESGFRRPSPVQLQGIPLGKCGFDLLLEAKSGTGKTAVFTIIALEKLNLSKGLQVIILAPTREIASQICDVIKQIGSKLGGLVVEVVMGGLSLEEDVNKFKKNVHIVVGSPGRLRHLIQDKHINTSAVRLLVFDEVDMLMQKSFQADINYIFSTLPDQKQVILSSATYTETTKDFVKKYVKSAQHIQPNVDSILLGIEQKFTTVKFNANIVRQTQYKFEELLAILSSKTFKQCLIFCNYQARVTELYKLLSKQKWPVEQLYGQQEQTDRLDALKTLQDYKCRILVSTDLAARGIDASNVDVVINFEPPFEWQTYLHRIGRAGRYGSYGMSITILSEGKEEKKFFDMLQSMKVPLKITSLWSNSKDSNTQSLIDIQFGQDNFNTIVSDKCKELWEEFTTNSTNGSEEIENFESLCQSFEAARKPHVESFDDLLKSYKLQEKPSPISDKYQHIQISTKVIDTIDELSINFKSMFTNSLLDEETKELNPNNYDIESKPCVTEVKTPDKSYKSTKNNIDISKNYEDVRDNILYTRPEKKVKNTKLQKQKKCDTEIIESTQIESGPPMSRNSNRNCIKNTSKNQMDEKVKNLSSKQSFHTPEPNKDSFRNECTSTFNHKSRSNYEHEPNKIRKSYVNQSQKNTDSQDYTSENYTNWYNQLKYRMKQIELAFYIEEMSQLYSK